MENIILIAIILIAVGSALFYIYKEKKNGQACIGCPNSKQCGKTNCSEEK
ncbi:MAG: FeoB-associated Cys-rich membrane protein [Ruminococcaceae bacterium]|nr:FeoB-associated Cys-rich membrane protein [Oscillospiraceae bacterium]